MSRIPKDKLEGLEKEPMIRNGNGTPPFPQQQPQVEVVGKLTDGERAIIMAKTVELEEARRKQTQFQRELTLLAADMIHKGDEFEAKIKELSEKYKLKKGVRELNLKTGEIVAIPGAKMEE